MEGDSYRLYISGVWKKFQPTPSVGRATCASSHGTNLNLHFNPLPPWGGRQASPQKRSRLMCHFNPRPPWGGRPISHERGNADETISIHALRGEGDLRQDGNTITMTDFNPRPPWGGRPYCLCKCESERVFQSTPSVGRATGSPLRLSACSHWHFNPRPPWGGRLRD